MPPELETPSSPTPGVEEAPNPSLLNPTPESEEPKPGEESKPGEEPKPEEKPAEPTPVEPLTAADITFPEGFEINEALRDEFLTIVNDNDMSPKDRAQALVALQTKAAQAASEASSQAWTDMQTKWQDEVKADLGDKLQPTLGRIGKLVSEYGSNELTAVFDLTGAGNNLHVIKFLDKIAEQLTESGPASGSPAAQEGTAAQRLFPSMKG